MVIETGGLKIMTDPGSFSVGQENETGVNYILITHEHADHVHVESLKKVLANNVDVKIITNNAVKKLLDAENISCEVLEEDEIDIGVKIYAKTCPHADIFDGVTPVQNTGYMIDNKLFYPGDAWLEINKPVEILALPVAGPWSKIRDAIEYGLRINPKYAFPVHDGMIKETMYGSFHALPTKVFAEKGIDFKILKAGESFEI